MACALRGARRTPYAAVVVNTPHAVEARGGTPAGTGGRWTPAPSTPSISARDGQGRVPGSGTDDHDFHRDGSRRAMGQRGRGASWRLPDSSDMPRVRSRVRKFVSRQSFSHRNVGFGQGAGVGSDDTAVRKHTERLGVPNGRRGTGSDRWYNPTESDKARSCRWRGDVGGTSDTQHGGRRGDRFVRARPDLLLRSGLPRLRERSLQQWHVRQNMQQ